MIIFLSPLKNLDCIIAVSGFEYKLFDCENAFIVITANANKSSGRIIILFLEIICKVNNLELVSRKLM